MTEPDDATKEPLGKRMGHWGGYHGFRMVERLTGMLSPAAAFKFGSFCGTLAYRFLPSYRKLALRNLRIAFGSEKSDDELQQMLRAVFRRLGANFLSSIRFSGGKVADVAECIRVEGRELVDEACADGKGVVMVIAHGGPWEVFTLEPKFYPSGRPLAAIYQALSNPRLNQLVLDRREQMGIELLDRRDGLNRAADLLKEGGVLGILADQHAGDAGVFMPFVGRLASTTNLPALLAKRAGAALFTLSVTAEDTAKWVVRFEPVSPTKLEPNAEKVTKWSPLDAMTDGASRSIEAIIRRSPEDWFWVHNRWKTPKPEFLLTNHRRGIRIPPGTSFDQLKPFRIVLRSPNWLGDACMAMPAVRAIKRGRPDAELTVIAPAKFADIWSELPEVDASIASDGKDSPRDVAAKLRATGTFDAGILMTNSPRTAMEMWFADVRRIVGYPAKWRRFFLDQEIQKKVVANGPPAHHVEYYLQIAHRIGADCSDRTIFDPIPGRDEISRDGDVVKVGICAGAEYGTAKRWPQERYAAMTKLVNESSDLPAGKKIQWVLFGAPGERELGEQLSAEIGDTAENLVGKTTIIELMDRLRECEFIVSNDTGTMHLAATLGVPAIAIFGSTEPRWTRPLGKIHTILREHVECSPCFLRECPIDFRCMKAITPERVASEVLERMKSV